MSGLTESRITTLTERLGEAADLVDNKAYLPMFRNRQIAYGRVFAKSVEIAKRKKNPARYFASIWAKKVVKKTVEIITSLLNQEEAKKRERAHNKRKLEEAQYYANRGGAQGGKATSVAALFAQRLEAYKKREASGSLI